MKGLIDWIKLLPTPVQIAVVCLVLGTALAYAHESRYMTVDQFTKSYVLDLKREIRELEMLLRDPELDEQTRTILFEQLERMIDELCYEMPDDPYCTED
jgi:hypothetical protein